MSNHHGRGFTLVELLVTMSLMAMVGAAVVAALFGGIRVFQRATDYGSTEQAAMVMSDGLRRDLEGLRRFTLVPFDGRYEAVAFAAVGKDRSGREAAADEPPEEIGRLAYYYNARSRMLCRSFIPYRLSRRVRTNDRCSPVLDNVERIRFDYFGAPEKGDEPTWVRHWDGKETPTLPTAVKATVTVRPAGRQEVTRSFVVYLPGKASGEDTGKGDEPSPS